MVESCGFLIEVYWTKDISSKHGDEENTGRLLCRMGRTFTPAPGSFLPCSLVTS